MANYRLLGFIAVLVALGLDIALSVSITGFTISDTDPTTYIIVVMLMLFLFVLFYMKDRRIVPSPTRRSITYGALLLAAYVAAVSYSRVWLSYIFMSYRVDMLLLPLFLLSIIVAVFGTEGARRMKMVVIYSVFASPLILMPLLNLNSPFALANAYVVYGISRAIGLPLVQSGIMLTSPANSTISISTTCADIGAFVAFLMFLVPLTYLYDGKALRKLLWAASGVALLFALNIIRMMSIVLIWLYSGINSAVYVFHLFAGEVLFVLAIAVMMLIAYKFAIGLRRQRQSRPRRAAASGSAITLVVLALAFGAVGFAISVPYLGAINVHAGPPASQPNYVSLDRYVINTLESARLNVTQLPGTNSSMLFALGSGADPSTKTYVLVNYTNYMSLPRLSAQNSSMSESVLLDSGVTIGTAVAYSDGQRFAVNYFTIPYNSSGRYGSLTYEFLRNATVSVPQCSFSVSPIAYAQSIFFNALHASSVSSYSLMCESYAVANSLSV